MGQKDSPFSKKLTILSLKQETLDGWKKWGVQRDDEAGFVSVTSSCSRSLTYCLCFVSKRLLRSDLKEANDSLVQWLQGSESSKSTCLNL